MSLLLNWLLSALAVLVASYVLPGVHVSGLFAALVVVIVLGLINLVVKPLLLLLTLPVNILTLGLFTFVINALLILLASKIVEGFAVDGFGWALLFSVVLSLVNAVLRQFQK